MKEHSEWEVPQIVHIYGLELSEIQSWVERLTTAGKKP